MEISLRPISKNDLEMVLNWRNTERVRDCMFNNEIIKMADHLRWFENNKENNKCENLIFFYNQEPTGVVNFTNIDTINKKCSWGFYIGKQDSKSGLGTIMGILSLDYIFKKDIRKVSAEILDFNIASKRVHEKLRFIQEGTLINHIFRNGSYVDVILMCHFKERWLKMKDELNENFLKEPGKIK
ncbi:UDP-4-amino-4,6-dideoxy-N-acetyl-beta-L-altrosamine N-acetyltransferase [Paenibacillus thalictri]|uniref:UDP-4-amino-4, 6-dideoxy-N-acetyl-beta-L-altrosamine N-acetyltransferase n=1 Tax=Paenibacillus thalictri TaxID=2527873 RepID=A0A4Q9DC60_9BACL|nr:UDP-4-amino-4,6-dideoxy-N-acetyl-beta-L-altrosamine N-acetyltransferase [Paenibacillus thalictri]TBL67775.1 UDP-4-amino-4,6-dideoxy-N-acetyl-beta-L-altrosamine N-acetyltransferase [Paenibacillus thalictri]